jgi:diaminopimelate decarboxylase
VQEIRENDVLAILDAGAYGMAMASVYNLRPLPAEVVIHQDGSFREISPRLNEKELVDRLYEGYWRRLT